MTEPLPQTPAQPISYFRGERLREMREAKGFDVETLAKRLAVSPAQLRQLESNQNSLFYSEAIRLIAARKVSQFLGEALVIDTGEVTLATLTPPQICLAEPRTRITPASRFALSRWSAVLWLVALSFAGLVGLQGYRYTGAFSGPELAAAQARSPAVHDPADQPTAGIATLAPPALPPNAAMTAVGHENVPAELSGAAAVLPLPTPVLASNRQLEADSTCNVAGGTESSFTPSKPGKDAAQVFVQGAPGLVVCVRDSRGQVWRHEFAGTSGRSFFGAAPWVVESAQLAELQVYFQGARARPSLSGATRLRLVAAEPT